MTIKAGREEASIRDQEVPVVDFTDCLDRNETISSVNVSEITTTNAILTSPQANDDVIEVRGRMVEPGKAAMCALAGVTDAGLRILRFAATTSNNRVIHREVDLNVI